MNWYLQSEKDSDVAISTRIRYVRNIKGFKFNIKGKEELEKLEKYIKDNLYSIGYGLKFFKLKDMDDITKISLVEKNLISSEFALDKNKNKSILINDEENICIMIGGEEHLEIQVFNSGLDLENTLNLAIELDNVIGETLGYCINKKYGFLTSDFKNIGTGLKASVILHLPAINKTRNIKRVINTISNFGISINGIAGENGELLGDMYLISNKQTIGITEKEIVENLNAIVQNIMKQERQARKMLAKESIDLEDKIYRSFGILTNCKKISYDEVRNLLSDIKIGVDLGILKELTDLKVQKLYLYTKPANMQKYLGEKYELSERGIKRAEVIKQIINER